MRPELDGPDATAVELLQWTEDTFGTDYIVASNMQDGVLVPGRQVHPGVDVLFLDTGYHFAETIGTRDAVEMVYGVNVVNARRAHGRRAGLAAGQGSVRPRPQPSAAHCARSRR